MATYDVRPVDKRCHFYAHLVRSTDALPVPADVTSGYRIPGTDVARKVVDLQPGDWVLEGEANHHRKIRCYTHTATTVGRDGRILHFGVGAELREALKVWVERGPDRKGNRAKDKRGLPPRAALRRHDMKGAGGPAAMVRLVVADRAGIGPDRVLRTLGAIDRLPAFRRGIENAKTEKQFAEWRAESAKRDAARADWEAGEAMVRQAIEDGIESFVP